MSLLISLVVLGWLVHVLGDLIEASKQNGGPINPVTFIKSKPYRTLMSIIGAALGFLMLMHDLNVQVKNELFQSAYATAFGLGYAADSIINKAANIAQQRIDKT